MNKYIYLALSWVMIGLLSSCYDDKGNYDYDYIQSVILREELKDTVVTRGKVDVETGNCEDCHAWRKRHNRSEC